MKGEWVSLKVRDDLIDYVNYWHKRASVSRVFVMSEIGVSKSKFYDWSYRYGKNNNHNNSPKSHWLLSEEKSKIVDYYSKHPFEGCRRLSYMMIDDDVVYASPSSVYRVLLEHGLLNQSNSKASLKGTGFVQPTKVHEHWHTDISYINIGGTFYYFFGVLDGFSRYLLHYELRENMKTEDVQITLQACKEKHESEITGEPRIITDNGTQYTSKSFKEFVRFSSMDHVRTSPYYPQSNGKIERFHGTLKANAIRAYCPKDYDDGIRIINNFIENYNKQRLHSAIGYVTPESKKQGNSEKIIANRKIKLSQAKIDRAEKQQDNVSNKSIKDLLDTSQRQEPQIRKKKTLKNKNINLSFHKDNNPVLSKV